MKFHILLIILVLFPGFATADTPMDKELAEDQLQEIECSWSKDVKLSHYTPEKGTYHYTLFLPPGYNDKANKDVRYPCIMFASPGGNAKAPSLPWLRENGWMCIGLTESKNGEWGPITGNAMAAMTDAKQRLRLHEGLIITEGFSGGGRASGLFALIFKNNVTGVLHEGGASFTDKLTRQRLHLAVLTGDECFNASEIKNYGRWPANRCLLRYFRGVHTGPPKPLRLTSLDWLRDRMFADPKIKRDPATVKCYLDVLKKQAEEAEDGLVQLATWRQIQAALKANPGVAELDGMEAFCQQVETNLKTIKADAALMKEEKARNALEKTYRQTVLLCAKNSLCGPPDKRTISQMQTKVRKAAGKQFQALVQKYPDTQAAQRAEKLIQGFQENKAMAVWPMEVEKTVPTVELSTVNLPKETVIKNAPPVKPAEKPKAKPKASEKPKDDPWEID